MKIGNVFIDGRSTWGVSDGDSLLDVGAKLSDKYRNIAELLAAADFSAIKEVSDGAERFAVADVAWAPVLPSPAKIFCVGHNYESHVLETGKGKADHPSIFLRVPDSLTAHNKAIVRPLESEMLDFEGELAVIIGVGGRRISKDTALGHVAGYACFNDASVRDWQWHNPLVTPGKNFPMTGAFGPWMVTADEVGDPSGLAVTTRLNGEIVQSQPTSDMIFDVPTIIAYVSTFTSIAPGDVICTGTPGGVGAKRKPPLWMKPGDVIEVEIPGVGLLCNPIVAEP